MHIQLKKMAFRSGTIEIPSFYLKETPGESAKKAKKSTTYVRMDLRNFFKLWDGPSIVATIRGLFLCHNGLLLIRLYK